MEGRVSRRSLLAGLAAAGALLTTACASGAPAAPTASSSAPVQAPTAAPASAPTSAPAAAASPASAGAVQLAWWTHGAEEVNKRTMLGKLVDTYHQNHPNVTVTITWTQMPGIWQALQAAFTADSGYPDIFWYDTSHQQWAAAGWVAELSKGINWANVEPWAKQAGTMNGPDGKPGVYFLVEFSQTGELYYNKQMFKDFGITVPDNGQFDQDAFKGVVQTVTSKGVAAFANANGDRNYPGQTLPTYLLLSKLGHTDLVKLWKGDVPWTDSRVVDVFDYFESLAKLHAYPTTFASMTLSESHHYFHTEHKAAMFPCPSWYTSRAFVPVDKGGQPKDFQLGFLEYPAMTDGQGTKEKYLDPGGAQTAAAKSKYRDTAIDVLNGYTDLGWATDWVSITGNTTAVKIDPTKVKSDFPDYWTAYFKAQEGMTELSNIGIGSVANAGQQDVWYNVVSTGMPQGLISAKDAIQQLSDGWKKNAKP